MFSDSKLQTLKDKLRAKGISDPDQFANSEMKRLPDNVLNQIVGGFGQVLKYSRSHTQGGVHTQTVLLNP